MFFFVFLYLFYFFLIAPCKVGVYACDPAAGSITHKASGWVINPKGFSWKDCEFSIESNHSTMAAKLRNHTMGNTTSIFFLFHVAGRDLPKQTKSGLAIACGKAAAPAIGDQVTPGLSLGALKDQDRLPAIKDASPQKTASGSLEKPNSPALEDQRQTQLARGPDGVYRLTMQGGHAGTARGQEAAEPAETAGRELSTAAEPSSAAEPHSVPPAAKKHRQSPAKGPVQKTPRTPEAAEPVEEPKATAATSSLPAASVSLTAAAKAASAHTAAHEVSSQSLSRGRSRSRSSRRAPARTPSPAATSIYASEDEAHETRKALSTSPSQSPVRRRHRGGNRRIILSPAQKNLRRLREHRSLS